MKSTMYRKPSKKQLLFRRVIILIVTVFSVLVIVTGTILFILGYRLDSVNGGLEQGALVQFDSRPTGANITVDGVYTNSQTTTKRSLLAGTHSFLVDREQYNPWTRTIDLQAGTLTWLDYIRLVPKELQKQTVRSYTTVHDVKTSPDLQMIMVQEKSDAPNFELIDIREADPKDSRINLPQSLYSDATTVDVKHAFEMIRWDEDGRYLLVKHNYKDTSEWIVVDTENVSASVNITRLLSIGLSDVQFSGTSGNIVYGLTDGVIRKLDLGSATISRALVSRVSAFEMYESNILTYVGRDTENEAYQVAGLYRDGDRQPHVLRTVKDTTTPLKIDTVRYYNDAYVAISEGLKVTILKGSYPSAGQSGASSLDVFNQFTAPATIDQLTFSPEGDYLLVQAGVSFMSLEVEYNRLNSAKIETSETQAQPLTWLDGAHLTAVYDGHMSMRDFDGTNVHVIMPMVAGFDTTLSQNGRYIYGVNNTDGTYRLERVTMILE